MSCAVFLRYHLSSSRSIALLGSVRVELMILGTKFDSFGSICVPVPGLIVYLGIDDELRQE